MTPPSERDQRLAKKHISEAHERWDEALRQFYPFAAQLRRLADVADEQRKVAMVAELAELPWKPQQVHLVMPPMLQPHQRPGSARQWQTFDAAKQRLEQSFAGAGFDEVAAAYGDFASATRDLSEFFSTRNVSTTPRSRRRAS